MVAGFISGVMTVVHIIVSIGLILIVLLQSQQSMNLSGLFGGASQSALGNQPRSVLSKVTIILAIAFFVTTIFFALYSGEEGAILSTPAQRPAGQTRQQPVEDAPGPGQQPVEQSGEQPAEQPSEMPGPQQPAPAQP
jgi:preprotein translocase subunit SecG